MNEISVQQQLNTKPSAPDRQAGKSANVKKEPSFEADQAEVRQTEQRANGKVDRDTAQENRDKRQEEQVEQAVAKLNDYVQQSQRKLEFQVDEDSGQTVVKVYDKSSEELIRQIPNEEALELAQRLNQEEPLTLFSAQV